MSVHNATCRAHAYSLKQGILDEVGCIAACLHMLLCSCSDHANLLKETLEKQFEVVKERVSNNGTYMQGSHVLQFGSLSIDAEPASDYLGKENTGKL